LIRDYIFSSAELQFLHSSRRKVCTDLLQTDRNAVSCETYLLPKKYVLDLLGARHSPGWCIAKHTFLYQQDQTIHNFFEHAFYVGLVDEIRQGQQIFKEEIMASKTIQRKTYIDYLPSRWSANSRQAQLQEWLKKYDVYLYHP